MSGADRPSIPWPTALVSALAAGCFDAPAPPPPVSADADATETAGDAAPEVEVDGEDAATPCFVAREAGCARVVRLGLGATLSCAVLGDGDVWCWGSRERGALGDRVVAEDAAGPVRVEAPAARDIAVGDEHACALTIEGDVLCWGRNFELQAPTGGGPTAWTGEPTRVALPAQAAAIGAGARTTCALLVDGRVVCWGARLDGQHMAEQVPGGRAGGPQEVASLPGAHGVSAIRLGGWSGCAWANALSPALGASAVGGRDVVRCWGDNEAGQLGVGDRDDRDAPVALEVPARLSGLALGGRHACATAAPDELRCWGDNAEGQLARPLGAAAAWAPGEASALGGGAVALALGDANGCVVGDDEVVRCWGRGQEGLLGVGASGSRVRSEPVAGVPLARDVALGRRHACAVTTGEGIVCWGDGRDGQLDGVARGGAEPVPIAVVAPAPVEGSRCVAEDAGGARVEVRPGSPHPAERCRVCARDLGFVPCSLGCGAEGVCHAARDLAVGEGAERCAARDDGALVCWSGAGAGAVATGSATGLEGVARVALGDAWGCALSAGGDVGCWATGEAATRVVSGATALAVRGERACSVVGGEVVCWSPGAAPEPVAGLAALGPMRAVALSDAAACTLPTDGADLVCWGGNAHGELAGAGAIDGAPARVPVGETLAFDTLAGGSRHFVALRDDGRALATWGDDRAGQVGAGAGRTEPAAGVVTPIALRTRPARPLRDVAAGEAHSCVASLSGRVECWGDQGGGGVRTVLEGATDLAAGGDTSCAVVSGRVVACWQGAAAPVRVALEAAP